MTIDMDEMARKYMVYYAMRARNDPNLEQSFDDWLRVKGVIENSADDGLALLKLLVDASLDDGALYFVAAGPMEDFICRHEAMVPDVIAYAKVNSKFARALEGVWGDNRMSGDARMRMEQWRRRRRS